MTDAFEFIVVNIEMSKDEGFYVVISQCILGPLMKIQFE